jgi:hypothetical protein
MAKSSRIIFKKMYKNYVTQCPKIVLNSCVTFKKGVVLHRV